MPGGKTVGNLDGRGGGGVHHSKTERIKKSGKVRGDAPMRLSIPEQEQIERHGETCRKDEERGWVLSPLTCLEGEDPGKGRVTG